MARNTSEKVVAEPVAGRAAVAVPRPRFKKARETLYAYAYILPALVFIIFATGVGVVYTVYMSFTNFDGLEHFEHWSWVGLHNYTDVLFGTDYSTFVKVMSWTFVFAFVTMALSYIVGLLLALLLDDKNIRERNIYRTLLIIPWALPGAIAILAWNGILNTDFGYLNSFLIDIGLPKVEWLTSPNWARFSVLFVNTWFGFPFMMTACLGALQSVPDELDEAAQIDGASRVARFRFVKLPFLRSVTVPLLIGNFAFQFGNFSIIYLLTTGGPRTPGSDAGATDIGISYAYRLTLTTQRFAVAAAYGVVLFFIIGIISFVAMKRSGAFAETTR
jgi:arabinogalactan oligomer/maltooligosaccharide transport system permease protein